jgi:two-component system alkaline phosphatase synthesis response regulator PhoP
MPQKTVLVVDDSKVALMTEVMILRREGRFDIIEGKNGEEAIELAVKHQPDLILMDVNMPVMDGFEACRELRNKAETKSIPIILVTTRGEAENIEAGYENGCSDYVTKPIKGSELLSKIKNILGS